MSKDGRAKCIVLSLFYMLCAALILYNTFSVPPVYSSAFIETNSVADETDFTAETDTVSSNSNASESGVSVININTCSYEELLTLSGIGPSKAQAILEYRQINGGFSSIEEIKNVKGIGEKTYEAIRKFITV